jgi:hypothetical protein
LKGIEFGPKVMELGLEVGYGYGRGRCNKFAVDIGPASIWITGRTTIAFNNGMFGISGMRVWRRIINRMH